MEQDGIFMMTPKMQMLYMDIVASLGQLPIDQKTFIFGYEGEEDLDLVNLVASYIVLEFIKYSYDYADPEYSLRHFLEDPDDNSERMAQQRVMQYVLKYKKREIETKEGEISPDSKFANINMADMKNKLTGYKITEMNYFEHNNIRNLEIIKAIVEKRIGQSKKVSNKKFEEMLEQYDDWVESLIERSKRSDKDMVFASLALFTFEWHYPVEMAYELSCIMEEKQIDYVDDKTLSLLYGYLKIDSRFEGLVSTESRLVKGRIMALPFLFCNDIDANIRGWLIELIKEILALVVVYTEEMYTIDGKEYKEWFREESTMKDWASFFRYYDIFSIWQRKEWTNSRIKKMRHLLDKTF